MTDIPDGHGIIAGRSSANAKAAIEAAKAAGVNTSLVLAVPEGYLVPGEVLEAFHKAASADSEAEGFDAEPDATPTSDWKNADIEQWALDHGIDLGGATKKADMLDALSTAKTKEE